MPALKLLSDRVNLLVTALCAAFLVIMLGISFSGAIYQAVTGDALAWTYSLARQFLPWIALLSITVAFKNGEHVAMAMIVNALPSRIRLAVEWVIVASIGLFALILTIAGVQFALESSQLVMISDQIQISQSWVAASVPTTGIVLLVHLFTGRALVEGPVTTSDFTEGMATETDHINPERGT